MPAEEMKRFEPRPPDGDTSYDHVATLYDAAFVDIRVRKDEWRWLNEHLPAGKLKMLDIGCGNDSCSTHWPTGSNPARALTNRQASSSVPS